MRISDWSSDVCSSDLATKVEPPKPLTRECEEPACAVECLSDAGGWQLGAIAGKIDVEAGIEIGAHRGLHIGMFEHVQMHGNAAAPWVLADAGGTEFLSRVRHPRQIFARLARLTRPPCPPARAPQSGSAGSGRQSPRRAGCGL